MLKPDAIASGKAGLIVALIQKEGFVIRAAKLTRLTPAQAAKFYEVHKDRPFYRDLVEFMTSGPVLPMALERMTPWRISGRSLAQPIPRKRPPGRSGSSMRSPRGRTRCTGRIAWRTGYGRWVSSSLRAKWLGSGASQKCRRIILTKSFSY